MECLTECDIGEGVFEEPVGGFTDSDNRELEEAQLYNDSEENQIGNIQYKLSHGSKKFSRERSHGIIEQ